MHDHGGGSAGFGTPQGGQHHHEGHHHHEPTAVGHHHQHHHHLDRAVDPADLAYLGGRIGADGRGRAARRQAPVSAGARLAGRIIGLVIVAFIVYVAWHVFAGVSGW